MAATRTTRATTAKTDTEAVKNTETTEAVSEKETASTPEAKPVKSAVTYKVKELDPHDYVTVVNGFTGSLVYRSSRTGELFEWGAFGDEQEIELQELKAAKNSQKAFFENNWFLIGDPDVINYLGVERFYKDALTLENFDDVFGMEPAEAKKKINKLSAGQKKSVASRARQLIREGQIDSIKLINSLEECLGVELIEH